MSGVRKIVNAPSGAKVTVLPPDVRQTIHPAATPIQIVNDPSAPAYHMVRPDEQYPYRQKELIAAVRKELPNVQINGYDVLCIRRTHNVDQDKNFFYSPKFGSPQYSRDFATWIAQQVRKDKDFFERARRQAQGTQCDGD